MAKKYTLKDANDFVGKFQKTHDLAEVLNNFDSFKQSLKIFVNKNDKENFKKLTDKYLELTDYNGQIGMKRDAYILLETLCYDIDNRFMARKGKAVKLLEKFYSPREK